MHKPAYEHLLLFLVMVNVWQWNESYAKCIYVKVFHGHRLSFLLNKDLGVKAGSHGGRCVFHFLRTCQTIFQSGCTI